MVTSRHRSARASSCIVSIIQPQVAGKVDLSTYKHVILSGLGSFRQVAKRDAIANRTHLTVDVVATALIPDAVAVAHVEAVLGAVPPDRVLHEPGEDLREPRVELPGVDSLGDRLDDVCAPIWLIAGRTVNMVGVEPAQNARANEKVVHQRVDCDHAGADLGPQVHVLRGSQ